MIFRYLCVKRSTNKISGIHQTLPFWLTFAGEDILFFKIFCAARLPAPRLIISTMRKSHFLFGIPRVVSSLSLKRKAQRRRLVFVSTTQTLMKEDQNSKEVTQEKGKRQDTYLFVA